MAKTSRLLLAAIGCGAALAQSAPPSGEPASYSGRVMNSVTGDPILRAHVTLRNYGDQSQQVYGALTNAEGKFSIERLPAGRYTAGVEKAGYLAQYGPGPSMQFQLGPGDKKENVKLTLMPAGSITGRVLDSNDEPVEGAQVRVSMYGNGAMTDLKGQFRIGGLRPGKYLVYASETLSQFPFGREVRTDGSEETHHAMTYYPGTPLRKSAGRVTVTSGGETSGIEIRLVRTPIIRVSGRVIGLPGGARYVNIQLQSATSLGHWGGPAKSDGMFEVWCVDPGKYRISAVWQGPTGITQTAPVELEVADANIDGIELRYVAPADLTGVVQFDDEQAKPPDPLKLNQPPQPEGDKMRMVGGQPQAMQQRPGSAWRPMLQFAEAMTGSNYGRRIQAEVKPDGTFSLPQVAAGRYAVFTTWGPTYVKSTQMGALHGEGQMLDLTQGAGGNPVTIVVSSKVAEVSGVIRDGTEVAPGLSVVLMADPPDGTRPQIVTSRPDGTYKFGAVVPGKYRLAVIDKDDQSANPMERTPDDFEETVEATVLEGDKLTRDLRVAKR